MGISAALKKLYKKFLIWLLSTKIWSWLLLKVIPYVRFSMYYPTLRGFKYHQGYRYLCPGDIVLCVDKKKLTSLLVPGTFTHAAFCVGLGDKMFPGYEILEATHYGVSEAFFYDVCREADRVVILRPDVSPEYKKIMINNCIALKGTPYDVTFNLGIKALYCSEVIYQIDEEDKLEFDLTDIHALGTKYLSPDGIWKCKKVSLIWDSDMVNLVF